MFKYWDLIFEMMVHSYFLCLQSRTLFVEWFILNGKSNKNELFEASQIGVDMNYHLLQILLFGRMSECYSFCWLDIFAKAR